MYVVLVHISQGYPQNKVVRCFGHPYVAWWSAVLDGQWFSSKQEHSRESHDGLLTATAIGLNQRYTTQRRDWKCIT